MSIGRLSTCIIYGRRDLRAMVNLHAFQRQGDTKVIHVDRLL